MFVIYRKKLILLIQLLRFFVRTRINSFLSGASFNGIGFFESQVKIKMEKNSTMTVDALEAREYCCFLIGEKATLTLGRNVFFNRFCSVNCLSNISVGCNSIFGESVKIYDHDHVHKPVLNTEKFNLDKVVIGSGCWFGSNVVILKGSVVGDNVTVGAGVVIRGIVPSNSVVVNDFSVKLLNK